MISAYLGSIAALTPVPQSPTYTNSSVTSATPAQPSAQQILTAHLLVSLLSSPGFSMPLAKVKSLLAEKSGIDGSNGLVGVLGGPQNTNRVLYGCVAKRLVKIDRGGGEQTVKFDI